MRKTLSMSMFLLIRKKLSETERDELGELLKERAAALSEATGFEVHSIVD